MIKYIEFSAEKNENNKSNAFKHARKFFVFWEWVDYGTRNTDDFF